VELRTGKMLPKTGDVGSPTTYARLGPANAARLALRIAAADGDNFVFCAGLNTGESPSEVVFGAVEGRFGCIGGLGLPTSTGFAVAVDETNGLANV